MPVGENKKSVTKMPSKRSNTEDLMIGLARIEEKITGMNANVLELTVQMKETNSRLGATCEKVACLELSQEQLAKDQEAHENRQKAINGAVLLFQVRNF